MATTKHSRLTDEQRAERRRHEQELTERAVAQLRSSAGWQRWLMVRGRVGLRRYSVLRDIHLSGPFRCGISPGAVRRRAFQAGRPAAGPWRRRAS